jgi:uncharacterized protein (TIGR00661 family)
MKFSVEMDVIYAICSWGLGHATRSLPVLRKLTDEHNTITIISHGRSLELLQKELGETAQYIDIPDYPMLLSTSARQFLAKSMIYWPLFIKRMEHGLRRLTKLLETMHCDLIISDGRYDMYSKKIPSFFISHQMRIMNPLRIKMLESGSELFNLFFFKRFTDVIIPDYQEEDLSGDLSHNLKRIDENRLHYVGVLSDFKRKKKKKDVDFLISISGPEPQRSMLEQKLVTQVQNLAGNIVITLGKTEMQSQVEKEHVTMYSFLTKDKREDLLNRAKLVISRSGYSTIMDLAAVGTRALMIPTPGQIEQEYLAAYHNKKNTFYSVPQESIDLMRDVRIAEKTTGIRRSCEVEKTVERIMDIITSHVSNPC